MSKIYLIPTTMGDSEIGSVIPENVASQTKSLRCFIVENIKTARRYLRKMDSTFPIDDSEFFVLNKHTSQHEIESFVKRNRDLDIGIISEAGCPGIADPGAEIVHLAHQFGLKVVPMVGPSSIFMALMASGFNGQEFQFNGYLPKDKSQRGKVILQMEKLVSSKNITQIFMDTPFRNNHVVEDLIEKLKPTTHLCIASNITCTDEFIQSKPIKDWKKAPDLSKKPTIFVLGNPAIRNQR